MSRFNQVGFSLIELIVATAIGLIAIFAIGQFLVSLQSQYATLQKKISTEIEVSQLMFFVHYNLGMATNLAATPDTLNKNAFDGPMGLIRAPYDLSDWKASKGDGSTDVIAYFLRDSMSSQVAAPPAPANRFKATAIYFQRPTVDRFGVLYLNTEPPSGEAMRPNDPNVMRFENLVDFRIRDVVTENLRFPDALAGAMWKMPAAPCCNMVSAVTLEVVQRHYLPSVTVGGQAWCPPVYMPTDDCKHGNFGFRDITKTLTIKIRNNIMGFSNRERTQDKVNIAILGDVVFHPPNYRRNFENIYFFRASYPTGAMSR